MRIAALVLSCTLRRVASPLETLAPIMWRFSLALFAAASAVTAQPTVNPNVAGYGRISCTNYDGSPSKKFLLLDGTAEVES